jgi:hypothetical protein
MNKYRVCWAIDIEAQSPILAALIAEELQRSQSCGYGGMFTIVDRESNAEDSVDLDELLIPAVSRIAIARECLGEPPQKNEVNGNDG